MANSTTNSITISSKQNPLRHQRGQSLVEYLILVAIVGVGSMALVRSVGENLNVRFAKVVESLGGTVEGDKRSSNVTENMYRKKDLKNFMNGSVSKNKSGSPDANE